MTKYLRTSALKEERFIQGHSLSIYPQPAGSSVSGCVETEGHGGELMMGGSCLPDDKKEANGEFAFIAEFRSTDSFS